MTLASCRACVERHRAWYAREAARHDPDRGVPVVLEPPPWFDAEMDNLRAAFASAFDEQPCLALQLAASTWRAQLSRGQLAEALGWLTGALLRCPEVSALRTRALFAKGVLHIRRADVDPVAGVADAITEASQGLGAEAMAVATDQASIFTLMAHDWAGAKRRSATALARTGSPPASVACARSLRGRPGAGARRGGRRPGLVARGGRRARPCARRVLAVLHHVERVVHRRRPRGRATPRRRGHHVAGSARRRRPGARARGRGRRPRRASRRPDRSRPRPARRRHRPVHRGGRHLRRRLRARPARTHAAVGRRPGGGARLLRCRRTGPPIVARPALHRHGGRRAFLRRRPAGRTRPSPAATSTKRCR